MSKRINVNPDHYKVGGRERPGKDIVPSAERQALAQAARRSRTPHIPNQERASRPARPQVTRSGRPFSRRLPRRRNESA